MTYFVCVFNIVSTPIMFIPLASDTSIGAIEPRKSEGMNEETKEIRAVLRYASGLTRRIYTMMGQGQVSLFECQDKDSILVICQANESLRDTGCWDRDAEKCGLPPYSRCPTQT